MMKRLRIVFLVSLLLVGLPIQAHAFRCYWLIDLGEGTVGYGINDLGEVVGGWGNHAFLNTSGYMVDLGPGTAYDINNAGEIVGTSRTGCYDIMNDTTCRNNRDCAVVWTYPPVNKTCLGALHYLGSSQAYAINNGGFVVGRSSTATEYGYPAYFHAFIWDVAHERMVDLGVVSGDTQSEAWDINDSNEIVGLSGTGNAFYYLHKYPQGTMIHLQVGFGQAFAINNLDLIAGRRKIISSGFYPFLLDMKTGQLTDFLAIQGHARDINDLGQIVGVGFTPYTHACLWEPGVGYVQLDMAIHPYNPLYGTGLYLSDARAINNLGWIVANGYIGNMSHAFLLLPLPLKAAQLVTGSPVSLVQGINTPSEPFVLFFDYKFETTTGQLTVSLGGTQIGTVTAPDPSLNAFVTKAFHIDGNLLDQTNLELEFELEGPAGSTVLLGNITLPPSCGLTNGDFEDELDGWELSVSGTGSVVVVEVTGPEAENEPPVAEAGGPYSGTVGESITFDASGSYDPDGTIVSYEWDWNNDGVYDETTDSAIINHTWSVEFNGTVSLKVTDDDGATSIDTTTVKVTTPAAQGDLDHDGDVDRDDLNILLSHRNQPADQCPDCDLDGDATITVLDARKLVLMCTRPRCACE